MSTWNRRATPLLSVLAIFAVAACAERAELPTDPVGTLHAAPDEAVQTQALGEIARAVALALAGPEQRAAVLRDMRASPFPEHKLPLGAYLNGDGRSLLARAMVLSGHSRQSFDALLAELPPLEFYMPVPAHRATWTGGGDVLVAIHRLDDDDAAANTAFTSAGERVTLEGEEPPVQPTLVIGPAENGFSVIPDRSAWLNVRPAGANVIGNWQYRKIATDIFRIASECDPETSIEPCDPPPGGGSSGWQPPSNAVYVRGDGVREFIDQMWTPNDHEPWNKGAPEFRLFIAGTNDTDSNAELMESFGIPEDPWAGSDDEANAKPRPFGPELLRITDWFGYWGNVVGIRCIEEDVSFGSLDLTLGFSVEYDDVTVNVSATWSGDLGDNDDDCGQSTMAIYNNAAGSWTQIFSREDDWHFAWHGTNDLRWNGYGVTF